MAYATNIGLGRMAGISNLTYQELSTTAANFIRLETLKEANDIRSKVESALYGFHHPRHYKDCPLKPVRRIRERLIVLEWSNIERILLSLALKTTTQSVIVGKLSAYRRKNRTKRALWEFDNLIRSLYLLDYIDSPVLRRNVQRALNRGESYHQLRRPPSPMPVAGATGYTPSTNRRSGTSVPGSSATR